MPRPTPRELLDFLDDLAHYSTTGLGDYAALMARKADLLERIAADMPDDQEAAEVAALARTRADHLKTTD